MVAFLYDLKHKTSISATCKLSKSAKKETPAQLSWGDNDAGVDGMCGKMWVWEVWAIAPTLRRSGWLLWG